MKLFVHSITSCWGLWLVSALSLSSIGSCGIHQRTLEKVDHRYREASSYRSTHHSAIAQSKITWKEAQKRLIKDNIEIRDAKRNYERAGKKRRTYWKNYVPGVRIGANLSERLGSFDSLSLSNVSLFAFLNLRIPNPVTITGELQGLTLSEYRAGKSYELIVRRKTIALYQQFLRYGDLVNKLNINDKQKDIVTDERSVFSIILKKRTNQLSRESTLNAMSKIELHLSSELNTINKRWVPVASSLPRLPYRKTIDQLKNDPAYGRLALQILATDLEGTYLRYRRAKLSQWPVLSLNASTPQLYSSNGNNEFDVEAVSLFGGLTKGFDLVNQRGEEVEISREDYEKAIDRAKVRIQRDILTFNQAIRQYHQQVKSRENLRMTRKSLIRFSKTGLSPETLMDTLDRVIEADKKIEQLDNSLINKELEFWMWDEARW